MTKHPHRGPVRRPYRAPVALVRRERVAGAAIPAVLPLALASQTRPVSGLLAAVATICLAGAITAVIRVILAQHAMDRSKDR